MEEEVIESSGSVFTDLNLKACDNCALFTDEDINGVGWCQFHDGLTRCDKTCRHWTERTS